MGVIGKTFESDVKVDGYPLEGTVYYIYCDNCGSFQIITYFKAVQWFILVLLITISAACWNYLINNHNLYGNKQLACWIIYLVFIFIVIVLLSPYFPHKCLKCGNTNITYKDVLKYSLYENLDKVFDVPEAHLHKHNKADMNLIVDVKAFVKEIPSILLTLLFMIFFPVIILFGILTDYIESKIKK